jgi:hypothetical protein
MNLLTNQNSPSSHYIEVCYFDKNKQYVDRKHIYYDKYEAEIIYKRTVLKFTEDKSKNVIITLCDSYHNLLKGFRNYE